MSHNTASTTANIPSEGIFRTRRDVPTLAIRTPQGLREIDFQSWAEQHGIKGRTFGDISENALPAILKELGLTQEQYNKIPILNSAEVFSGGLGVGEPTTNLSAFKNIQPATVQQVNLQGPVGGLSRSVGAPVGSQQVGTIGSQTPSERVKEQPSGIPFKGKLNPEQKKDLTNLLKKPIVDWTVKDTQNWKSATGQRKPTQEEANQMKTLSIEKPTPKEGLEGKEKILEKEGKVTVAGQPQEEKKFTDISELPEDIRNNPLFKKLDTKQQEMLAGSWKAMQEGSVLTQIRWNEAMKEATKLADPIFKSQIRLAQDQLERSITSLIANNESARKEIETRIGDLREDLKTRGERFTAEQFEQKLRDMEGLAALKNRAERESDSREGQMKADIVRIKNRIEDIEGDLETRRGDITVDEEKALARQLRQYKDELKQAQQGAVNAGLGFSSIREEAEQRLKEELQDVSESTRRQAARQIRDIELETGRGKRDLGLKQEDIERQNQEARVDLARELERRVGFENIPENIKRVLGESFAALKTEKGEQVRSELDIREQERQRKAKQEREDIERVRVRAEREREIGLAELERERKEKLTAGVREGESLLGTANLPTLATEEVKPLGTGETPPIQGTLEQQQTERIGAIRRSLLESQPLFSSQI